MFLVHLQGQGTNQEASMKQVATSTLAFKGRQGVISQKTELFVTTAVRTSNMAKIFTE
jgi:hypothetical protein